MKLTYEEPEMQIRKYSLPPNNLITTSGEVDLGDGDHHTLPNNNYFA